MTMTAPDCDALVLFGATGDLAYQQVFPALQAMFKHGHLDLPIIGVARSGWNFDQLRDRAHDSLHKQGGLDDDAFAKLSAYIRAGKQLPVTCTEVMVQLTRPAPAVFDAAGPCRPNYFRFRLSPDVLISVGA